MVGPECTKILCIQNLPVPDTPAGGPISLLTFVALLLFLVIKWSALISFSKVIHPSSFVWFPGKWRKNKKMENDYSLLNIFSVENLFKKWEWSIASEKKINGNTFLFCIWSILEYSYHSRKVNFSNIYTFFIYKIALKISWINTSTSLQDTFLNTCIYREGFKRDK